MALFTYSKHNIDQQLYIHCKIFALNKRSMLAIAALIIRRHRKKHRSNLIRPSLTGYPNTSSLSGSFVTAVFTTIENINKKKEMENFCKLVSMQAPSFVL